MEYNEVAAKWWADKLRYVSLDNFDMGGDDEDIRIACMYLATIIASEHPVSEESINAFEVSLAQKIEECVLQDGDIRLISDYHPDHTLRNIARKFNIPDDLFPWKCMMHVSKDKVEASFGYGAPYKTIFSANNDEAIFDNQ